MRDNQESESKGIIVQHVRADAWELLERIKTTRDRAARRQLARQAFHLAQVAAMEEGPAKLTARPAGAAGNGTWHASAPL